MLTYLYPSILIVSFFVLFFSIKFIKGSIALLEYFYWILFGIYTASLVSLTLFPFPFQKFLIQVMVEDKLGLQHNFIPFKGIKDAFDFGYLSIGLKQIGGNVLLFIPIGFGLPILFSQIKYNKIIFIGLAISLTIELVQAIAGYFIGYNYRAFDVDDLIINTLGTFLGLFLFKTTQKYLKRNNLLLDK